MKGLLLPPLFENLEESLEISRLQTGKTPKILSSKSHRILTAEMKIILKTNPKNSFLTVVALNFSVFNFNYLFFYEIIINDMKLNKVKCRILHLRWGSSG